LKFDADLRGEQKMFVTFAPRSFFRERMSPVLASPAGYAALVLAFDLPVPLPRRLTCVSPRNQRMKEEGVSVVPRSNWPGEGTVDHLVFALKYEGVNLLVLRKVFAAIGTDELCDYILSTPTGQYARRLWFLYEFLTGEPLPVPDAVTMNTVLVLDTTLHLAPEKGETSLRHRVVDNLPGSVDFCPIVYRTGRIEHFLALDLTERTRDLVETTPPEVLHRAAAFMMLADSKASFEIEGETSSRDRMQRWAKVIGEAGKGILDDERLLDLQKIVIPDTRFIEKTGFRDEGGFVGRHAADGTPRPEHISARPEDLDTLMQGLHSFARLAEGRGLDPVADAACQAFGFVYAHPFEDGNGRIHRFIMHHVLARRGFTPPGIVFPISAVMLERVIEYRNVLRTVSEAILPFIDYSVTAKHNIRVTSDSIDLYRYFDATPHVEFLFDCVHHTLEEELPAELSFLQYRDAFHAAIGELVDMPERTIDLMIRFLRQNHGSLSRRARAKEFAALTDEEAGEVEDAYTRIFTP